MIELIFDTETTGFASNKPLSDPTQPYLIQLAAICFKDGEEISSMNKIIKVPIEVPEGAFAVHGISQAKSQVEGVPLHEALVEFNAMLSCSDLLVAFNIAFDLKILLIAYARALYSIDLLDGIEKACTMKSAAHHFGFPSGRVALKKAYAALVDPKGFSDAHDAMADTLACAAVYEVLKSRGAELLG